MSDKELQQQNEELIVWLRKALQGKYGIWLHNMLLQVKYMVEEFERDKKKK